jgi:hypothetical protein
VLSAPDDFNTLGNLSLYPHAGLLFLDFERGALLALSADVAIEAVPHAAQHHPGAGRVLHFAVRQGSLVTDARPLTFGG